MNMILLACIPVALGAGLLWGFVLGRRLPRAENFPTPDETAARLAQQAWEKHWAATREADQAAFDQANARYSAPLKPNANGDLKTVWMHTHIEH